MKRKKLKVTLVTLSILLLIGIGAVAGYTIYLTGKAKDAATEAQMDLERGSKSDKREEEVNPEFDNTSVLFIGIDDSDVRQENNARSDALVLATFNDDEKSVKLVSIPRDSYVYIPEVGYEDKITHAHAFGGVDATIDTVEEMFDIPVDYYVRLNFNSFIEVVDALNGIYYDVPFDMAEQNSEDTQGAIVLDEGYQELNGEEALALARTRKYDSDLARGQRQMEIIKSMVSKATQLGSIKNYDKVIDSIGSNMKTNMTFNEMLAFKDYVLNREALEFESMQLNGEGTYIGNGWYFKVKPESISSMKYELKNHLGLEQETSSYAKSKEDEEETSVY